MQINDGSTDTSGLPVQLSTLPSGPLDVGSYFVTLTIANPFSTSSCSAFLTVVVRALAAVAGMLDAAQCQGAKTTAVVCFIVGWSSAYGADHKGTAA